MRLPLIAECFGRRDAQNVRCPFVEIAKKALILAGIFFAMLLVMATFHLARDRVAANVGKALEAYMRKNTTGAAALDRFLAGDPTQLIAAAQRGLSVFVTQGCASCHSGPLLSDEKFHDVGFPSLAGAALDVGRPAAIAILQNNIFNLGGPFADPDTGAVPPSLLDTGTAGAFRTPSLRNVTLTAPYGHDGAITTLDDVLALHAPSTTVDQRGDLLAFFGALSGDYPQRPWNNWPVSQ